MKWIYRAFTLIMLGGALSIPFFIKNNQGEPMMSLPELKDLAPSALVDKASNAPNDRTFYKWKDEKGVWHYGDQQPENAQFSTLVVNDNTNIIQSPSLPEEEPPASTEVSSTNPKMGYKPPQKDEDALTLDRALNIVNDAHATRDMMEQRNRQLDAIVGNKEKK